MLLDKISCEFIEKIKSMHASSKLPTCILDDDLHVMWANDAAKSLCPVLLLPNGADSLLQQYNSQDIKDEIAERGSFAPPASEYDLFSTLPQIIYRSPSDCGEFYILHLREWKDSGTGTHPQGLQHSIASFESNFRMPLSAISSALSLLKKQLEREHLKSTTVENYIEMIGTSSTELLRSTQMVTDYTRLSNGIYSDKLVRVDLVSYLEAYLEEMAIILQEHEVDFAYSMADICNKSIFVVIAKEPLHFILCQLVSNACRFGRPGNCIRISITSEEDKVSIIVSDRGLGIPAAVTQRIFEPFFSHSPQGASFAGNGLGLAIAQQCAAYLKGELTFTTSEGRGTSFRLTLPIVDDHSLALEAHTPTDDLELSAQIRVLLADALPCEHL